jgi:NAD(P)-dependent dehydrogenase (short-subunit alcohol dehydrogenase family)
MTEISAKAPFVQGFDKVTLVTGGSKGIGKGCARVFAAAGAKVVICARGSEAGEALAAEITARGPGTCHFEPCDVSKTEDIRALIEKTVRLHGRLDCLINNAARYGLGKSIDASSIEEFQSMLQTNLMGYFVACKYALPHLRKTRGCIINMGSIVGACGTWHDVMYSTTKGGIHAMTKSLAIDEAEHGVRVNAVLPGSIITEAREDLEASMPDAGPFHAWAESLQWMGRSGTMEEAGLACLFLASDAAAFITGIELPLSGGIELGVGPKGPIPNFT